MPDPDVGFVQRNQAYDKGIPPLLYREPISWCGDPEIWLNGARQGIDPELTPDVWGYPECCKHPNQKIKLFNKTLGSVVISTRNNATTSINHTTGGSVVITSGSAVSATYPYTVIPPWDSYTNLFVSGGSIVIGEGEPPHTTDSSIVIGTPTCDCHVFYSEEIPSDPVMDDLLAWYRAEDLALSDNDPIDTWPDNSGNGYDLTQSNPSIQPIYHSGPVVSFDGTQYFESPVNWSTPITVFAVFKHTADSVGSIIGSTFGGVQYRVQPFGAFGVGPFGPMELVQTYTFIVARTCMTIPLDEWVVTSISCDNSDVTFKKNTCFAEIVHSPISIGGTTSYVGTIFPGTPAEQFIGELKELVIYSAALSPEDMNKTQCYLANKYSV